MITFRFDGRDMTAPDGATIASALLGNGVVSWRVTRRGAAPRGLFCGIGHCHDCLVSVNDARPVRACQTLASNADDVRSVCADPPPNRPDPPSNRTVVTTVRTWQQRCDNAAVPTGPGAIPNPAVVTTPGTGRERCDNAGVPIESADEP